MAFKVIGPGADTWCASVIDSGWTRWDVQPGSAVVCSFSMGKLIGTVWDTGFASDGNQLCPTLQADGWGG